MIRRYDDPTQLIGNTPLVRLRRLPAKGGASIYGKLEMFNPGGSVKDRIALSMIEDAEEKKLIKRGDTIVEPTSGNTGIGLALVGVTKGYRVILTMSENMSEERKRLFSAFGVELVLTPAEFGMQGAIDSAEERVRGNSKYFMPNQFSNQANPDVHRRTTALEILKAMRGESIDAFVAGVGTGGTITGVGEVLKGKNPNTRIVAVEPLKSAVLSGHAPGAHDIQGIGAGFIPKVLNVGLLDEIIPISDEDAYDTSLRLAREEALRVGLSSGAACHAAIQVAARMTRHQNVVVVFPDTGERYLSYTGPRGH